MHPYEHRKLASSNEPMLVPILPLWLNPLSLSVLTQAYSNKIEVELDIMIYDGMIFVTCVCTILYFSVVSTCYYLLNKQPGPEICCALL